MQTFRKHVFTIIVALVVVIVGLQIWAAFQNNERAERILEDLRKIEETALSSEKSRQEVISLRLKNEMSTFFLHSLLSTIGPMVTALVAVVGALVGLHRFLDARDKERLDRAATDFKAILDQLASDKSTEKALGIVGLQHFLTPDKEAYHLRALAALATAARFKDEDEVARSIRITAERAFKSLSAEMLGKVSWQGARIRGVDLSGCDLSGCDLRDAVLEDARLRNSDLSGARLDNARLKGARLDGAKLEHADLTYADLAGASFNDADLRGARLKHAKVLEMDVAGADLAGARLDLEDMPWGLVSGWRQARYDDETLQALEARYGPEPSGLRVLMLMWEIPPLVAGGSWTACYHLVRNIQSKGGQLTVVVPWDMEAIDPNPFECEVEIRSMGISPPRQVSPYAGPSVVGSAYGGSSGGGIYAGWGSGRRPGGRWAWSSYGSTARPAGMGLHPYWSHGAFSSTYGPYWVAFEGDLALPDMLGLINDFRDRVLKFVDGENFDVLHAHDWVTFKAARAIAEHAGLPWVAHLHSTESDRRPTDPDPVVEVLERIAVASAAKIVVPSEFLERTVVRRYAPPESKINVIPNVLSAETIDPFEVGSYESKTVIFLGRLTAQKGPDLFRQIAHHARSLDRSISFRVYGDGEERHSLMYSSDLQWCGSLDWSQRSRAFAGASALVAPSRSEPFGMVIPEAMQHGVPVLCTKDAGATEVFSTVMTFEPDDTQGAARQLVDLLASRHRWQQAVEAQGREVQEYVERRYEDRLLDVWSEVAGKAVA